MFELGDSAVSIVNMWSSDAYYYDPQEFDDDATQVSFINTCYFNAHANFYHITCIESIKIDLQTCFFKKTTLFKTYLHFQCHFRKSILWMSSNCLVHYIGFFDKF